LRTFIAIDLPAGIRTQIHDHQHSLARVLDDPPIRWVKPDSIHLTLKFLGEISPQKAELIGTEMPLKVGGFAAANLLVGGLGCFPNFNRPRVLWIGLQDQSDVLRAIQDHLERWLQSMGFEAEKRNFSPHLTIGRIHRRVGNHQRKEIGERLKDCEVPELGSFMVNALYLYMSELKSSGAVYTRLATARLGTDHE
jgi:2'-5' RNA ligase